jgi:hypothetical protein
MGVGEKDTFRSMLSLRSFIACLKKKQNMNDSEYAELNIIMSQLYSRSPKRMSQSDLVIWLVPSKIFQRVLAETWNVH